MGRPRKNPEPMPKVARVRCLWPNVWTSRGKLLKGTEIDLPADEAEMLDTKDAIKIVRPADANVCGGGDA